MDERSRFYISTPIYYVNGSPHFGHAYTTLLADMFARHYRQRVDEVFFLTGTDEHGLKIQRAAEERGIRPKELADENSGRFRALFERLEISNDRFIRTTEAAHYEVVHEVVRRMKAQGDIYLGTKEGWYAAADEAWYDESEITDGVVDETGATVEWVEEETYFFRLSAYQDRLLAWYDNTPECIKPSWAFNKVRSDVAAGLSDLSISRTTFDWGVPFPDDPKHVIYVWVDALTNYISGVDAFQDGGRFERLWPADVHIIGKDILWFHAVYWPAFLLSAGLELPHQILTHGWWLAEGKKIGKRFGNTLDPYELAEDYPLDTVRYYVVREVPLGSDGNFVRARLVERHNSELADNLGNLANRTTSMTQRFLEGRVPEVRLPSAAELDVELVATCEAARDEILAQIDARELGRALERVMELSSALNLYIQNCAPWKLAKSDEPERLAHVLYHALEGLRWVAVLAYAFIPEAARKLLDALGGSDEAQRSFATLSTFGQLASGVEIRKPDVLFPKLEPPAVSEEEEGEATEILSEADESLAQVSFDHFMSIDIRVGLIIEAARVEGADKLLQLSVDVGEASPRTVVAGIAKSYEAPELVGQRVAVVCNLKPAKLFGIMSEAMLLAAHNAAGKLELARYSEDVEPGTRIK